MDINKIAITVPLKELVIELLEERDSRAIDLQLAKLIYGHLGNEAFACIEWEGCDDYRAENPTTWTLERPILWRYDAWQLANGNRRLGKKYAHDRRIADWIRDENVVRLKRHIMPLLCLDEQQANMCAYKMIHGNKLQQIKALGFEKWARTEDDL